MKDGPAEDSSVMNRQRLVGLRLLLMGSKAFLVAELPADVKSKIDEAIARNMTILVGEALGACRLYQDYLHSKGYRNVIVGHAKSMRYNADNWKTVQYGDDLKEREKGMIEDCDSAIVIWTDASGVIAENLEMLKNLGKPTFIYEHSTKTGKSQAGWLDPARIYDPFVHMKEYFRKKNARKIVPAHAQQRNRLSPRFASQKHEIRGNVPYTNFWAGGIRLETSGLRCVQSVLRLDFGVFAGSCYVFG